MWPLSTEKEKHVWPRCSPMTVWEETDEIQFGKKNPVKTTSLRLRSHTFTVYREQIQPSTPMASARWFKFDGAKKNEKKKSKRIHTAACSFASCLIWIRFVRKPLRSVASKRNYEVIRRFVGSDDFRCCCRCCCLIHVYHIELYLVHWALFKCNLTAEYKSIYFFPPENSILCSCQFCLLYAQRESTKL